MVGSPLLQLLVQSGILLPGLPAKGLHNQWCLITIVNVSFVFCYFKINGTCQKNPVSLDPGEDAPGDEEYFYKVIRRHQAPSAVLQNIFKVDVYLLLLVPGERLR